MMRRHHAGARGMSLVELMVALVILVVMSVLGWRALDGILRSRAALSAQLEQVRGHQLAFAQLEADCAHIVRSTAFNDQPTLSAVAGRLILLRNVSEDDGADLLQIVVYRSDGGVLTRSTSAATRDLDLLHTAWQSALSGADHFDGVALDTQIAAFELKTWGGGAWQKPGAATVISGPRTRRVVQAPVTDLSGLQVLLRPDGDAGPLVRMFMLGAG